MYLVNRGIILHKYRIVFKDCGKVLFKDFKVDFNCNVPPRRILVPLYYY
jgi:hypothetical protein